MAFCAAVAALANGKQPMPQAAIAYLCEINKSTPTKDGIPVLTQVWHDVTKADILL